MIPYIPQLQAYIPWTYTLYVPTLANITCVYPHTQTQNNDAKLTARRFIVVHFIRSADASQSTHQARNRHTRLLRSANNYVSCPTSSQEHHHTEWRPIVNLWQHHQHTETETDSQGIACGGLHHQHISTHNKRCVRACVGCVTQFFSTRFCASRACLHCVVARVSGVCRVCP